MLTSTAMPAHEPANHPAFVPDPDDDNLDAPAGIDCLDDEQLALVQTTRGLLHIHLRARDHDTVDQLLLANAAHLLHAFEHLSPVGGEALAVMAQTVIEMPDISWLARRSPRPRPTARSTHARTRVRRASLGEKT